MKRIISIILAGFAFLAASSCVKEMPEVMDELTLGRCLTPTNVTAKIQNGEWVVLNWDKSKAATLYTAEFHTSEDMSGTAAVTQDIKPAELPYTVHLEADMTYFLRVIAKSDNPEVKESKWYNHDKAILTSAIKTPLDPEVIARAEGSITMKWKVDPEVDHIRIEPSLDGESEYTSFAVTSEAAKAGTVEVTGLNPSTYYTLTLHFKSAERGTVRAWTRPSSTDANVAANSEDLIRLVVTEKAAKVLLTNLEEPYVTGAMELTSPVELLGQNATDGTMPVVNGSFNLKSGASSIHLEGIDFNGAAVPESAIEAQTHLLTVQEETKIEKIEVINCKVHDFQRGIMYDSSKPSNYGSILFDGVLMSDIPGNGGDFFDLRKSGNIGSIKFINSTITASARTLIRIDNNAGTFDSFEMSNCTLNDLVNKQSSNNNGILHIRKPVSSLILKDNLCLNMVGDPYCQFISHNVDAMMPTEVSSNFYFNCQRTLTDGVETGGFFYHKDKAGAETGAPLLTANGGAILSDDPCEDSGNGTFNLKNETLISLRIGDPRWLNKHIVEPEDLTQEVTKNTPSAKTWNFADSKTFYKAADKDMVRDNIRFYVKGNPVVFNNGLFFSAAGAFNASDVEKSDCAASIKVDQPGSVVVTTEANGKPEAMLIISLDGKPAIGVPAGSSNFMQTFADIKEGEQHMIYFYGTDAIAITALQWNDETSSGGDKKLETPVVTQDKAAVNEGEDDTITLGWEEIQKAGSYGIILNGKTEFTQELSYGIKTKALAAGDYEAGVFAAVAADDKVRENSDTVAISFTVKEVLKKITEEKAWGAEYMSAGVAKYGNGTELKEDFVYGNMGYVAGGGKFKFGIDNAGTEKEKSRIQLGSTGAAGTKSNMQIMVAGNGTLELVARSSGDGARALAVAVGSTDVDAKDAPGKAEEPATLTYEVTANDGDLVNIYSKNSGINIYSIKWTPKSAPVEKTQTWDFNSEAWISQIESNFTAGIGNNQNDINFTYDGLTVNGGGKSMKYNKTADGVYFIQTGGAGKATERFFEFTAPAAGTLKVWTSNTGDSDDLSRYVAVVVGENDPVTDVGGYAKKDGPRELTFTVGEAAKVITYPSGNGLIFYKFEFTYKK